MESQEAKKPVRVNRLPKGSRSAVIRKLLKEGWGKQDIVELIGCTITDVCNVINRDRQRRKRIKELKAAGIYKSPASRQKKQPKKPKEEYYIQPQSIDDMAIAKHMGALGAGLSNHVNPNKDAGYVQSLNCMLPPRLVFDNLQSIKVEASGGITPPKKTLWRRFVDFICGE